MYRRFIIWLAKLAITLCWSTPSSVLAADESAAILGKNEWLFYKYELADASQYPQTQKTSELIKNFNAVLSARGITLTVVMVPIKMRVYAEFLPDDTRLDEPTRQNYARMLDHFKTLGINVADVNSAFMGSHLRLSDTPLFFRLDSHWTPTGAMVAAEAVTRSLEAHATSARWLAGIPNVGYSIKVANQKRPSRGRDLVHQLPPNAPTFEPEKLAQVNIFRSEGRAADLLGNPDAVEIGLVGSSYSRDWTGFPDALRYVLQRDVVSLAVGADQGSWVGMEHYLRDEAFQSKPPKLLIWEMPERDMHAPPDYLYREARYISSNADWLKRVTQLVNQAKRKR